MNKYKILLLGMFLVLILITNVFSQNSEKDILSELKTSSKGVSFENIDFGNLRVRVNSAENKIAYKDLEGKTHTLEGIASNGVIELDSKGNIIRGDFTSTKSQDIVLSGNLVSNIPINTKVFGNDGRNFDVVLASNSIVDKEPSLLNKVSDKGDIFVNYKVEGKSKVKFPDFNLQEGVLSSNGKNFLMKRGSSVVLDDITLFSDKEIDRAVFFNENKVTQNIKEPYSVVDLKNMIIKNIGMDKKSSLIDLKQGNPLVNINPDNRLGFNAGPNGQANIQKSQAKVVQYVQGKFVSYNGKLYLYHRGTGLTAQYNELHNKYLVVPVYTKVYNQNGDALLLDSNGYKLGLLIQQSNNGLPQVTTVPENNINSGTIASNQEIPNWQHNPNPESNPINGPSLNNINPSTNNPDPNAKYPFTKEEFLKDTFGRKTKGLASWLAPNLGELLKSFNPQLFNKHFGPGSKTSIDQAFTEYQAFIESQRQKYGQSAVDAVANRMKENQPDLYIKYGNFLGFR